MSLHQMKEGPIGGGSGRSLPNSLLIASTISALFATVISIYSINLQLRNYRKPALQRYVVRLLVMVPIYSLSSLASLFSLDAAFVIDLVRDIYEAFVILSFFSLLVEYLGGERSLLILVHGRKPVPHPFPVSLFFSPLDISDPYTFLGLKRGVLQYVQIKPILAVLTVVLKSFGKYHDGKLAVNNGYTWISATYNISVFLSLYCLGMFWSGLSEDLAPFRVSSKFLCIKGIIFFSFWQGLAISVAVAANWITQIGPVRDEQYMSLALQDMLICLEMPFFALGHAYAFSSKDYIDPFSSFQSRLPAYYAVRDSIGMFDVISDSLTTIRGTGYGYQTFEPSEGVMHQGLGRERRSRAGLRYTKGGKAKYWLPIRVTEGMSRDGDAGARHQGPGKTFERWLDKKRMEREGYAPLLRTEAQDVVHVDPDLEAGEDEDSSFFGPLKHIGMDKETLKKPGALVNKAGNWASDQTRAGLEYFNAGDTEEFDSDEEDALVNFSDVDQSGEDERLYKSSRELKHGDYAFPNVDIQQEEARSKRWKDDEDMLKRHEQRKGQKQRLGRAMGKREKKKKRGGGGQSETVGDEGGGGEGEGSSKPAGVVDILVEDSKAEERERMRERRRGDPALRAGQRTRIFRREWESDGKDEGQRPEMEAEERPSNPASSSSQLRQNRSRDEEGTEVHHDYHADVSKRVEDDANKEQQPTSPQGDQDASRDAESDTNAKVETAEMGEEDQISTLINAPSEGKVTAR
ncbi:hypothetical protein CBS101457_001256 [Exobasidium rhododendri]|nr:hypothetical protein CBS101457_001256 [Exobasidium rhododendri]